MKTLVVYYSLEGNTDYAASRIAENIGADTLRLFPKNEYKDQGFGKYVQGGRSAIMGAKPKLEKYRINLAKYDRIIIGFPVWASTFAPPIRTFVEENRVNLRRKQIVAFACQAGSGAERALAKLKKCIGIEAFGLEAVFIDPQKKHSRDTDKAIDTFSNLIMEQDREEAKEAKSRKEQTRDFFSHWNYKKHAKFCTAVYLSLYAIDMTLSYFVCKALLDKLDEKEGR